MIVTFLVLSGATPDTAHYVRCAEHLTYEAVAIS